MGGIEVLTYDSNIIKGHYLNENGERDTTNLGDASYTKQFDKKGHLKELRIYDLEGNLFESRHETAIYRYKYDKAGNKLKASFYNKNDRPSPANKGVHINEYKYTDQNWLKERSYRDTANELIEYNGFARISWEFDSIGNVKEERYYNRYDNLLDSGVAILKRKYDESGNVTVEAEFDHLGNGIVMKRYERDQYGNITSRSFYTTSGLKSLDEENIHCYKYHYKNGVYFGDSYEDSLGALIELDNVAFSILDRNERGNVSSIKTYDSDSNLVLRSNQEYAIITYEYDKYDRTISEQYFGINNDLAAIDDKYSMVLYKLDKSGNVLWKGFFDRDGNLTTNGDGVSLYQKEYNRNNVIVLSKEWNLSDGLKVVNEIDW